MFLKGLCGSLRLAGDCLPLENAGFSPTERSFCRIGKSANSSQNCLKRSIERVTACFQIHTMQGDQRESVMSVCVVLHGARARCRCRCLHSAEVKPLLRRRIASCASPFTLERLTKMSSTSAVLLSVLFSIEVFFAGSLGSRKGFFDVAAGTGNCCSEGSILRGEFDCTLRRLRKGLFEERRERSMLVGGEGWRSGFAAAILCQWMGVAL